VFTEMKLDGINARFESPAKYIGYLVHRTRVLK
jgi:hypothetical protein